VGVGVIGVGEGVGWDVAVGVGVTSGFNAGADVGFSFGDWVDVGTGKVLVNPGCVPLPLATEFFDVPKPITTGSKTTTVIMIAISTAIIDHFRARCWEPEEGRPVPFEASYSGPGGVAWSDLFESSNREF
jgi:hypothetical protein